MNNPGKGAVPIAQGIFKDFAQAIRAIGEPIHDRRADEISMAKLLTLSLALLDRCDACLRVGGESRGSDIEVEAFKASGRPIYSSLNDIPNADGGS